MRWTMFHVEQDLCAGSTLSGCSTWNMHVHAVAREPSTWVLAHLGTGRQDAAVTDPDDRAQRSRAIFEQLRSAEPAEESSGDEPDLISRTEPTNPVGPDASIPTSDLSPSVGDPLDQPATAQEPSTDRGSTGEGADSPAPGDDGPSGGGEEPAAATPDPIPPPEAPVAAPS
jgi:hypothetical protein